MPTSLRILSYNIHQGKTVARSRLNLYFLKDAVTKLSPDIVFLQEVAGSDVEKRSKLWPETVASQLEALADEMWPHTAFAKNVIFSRHHHGNAILSRYPLLKWSNKNITVGRLKSRGVLHGTLEIPGKKTTHVHVMNLHLGLLQFERRRQIAELVKHVNKVVEPDSPLLIAGDFNDWRHQVSKELSDKLDLDEAFLFQGQKHARTFPSRFPVLHLDRIYFKGIQLKIAKVLKGRGWSRLSDHLPIMADFQIGTKEKAQSR